MFKRPYDLYIRYLFTTGLDDVNDVNMYLRRHHLDPISDEEYEAIAIEATGLIPRNISMQIEARRQGPQFMKWMQYLGVDRLYDNGTPEHKTFLKLVYDIHEDRVYSLTLHALMLKGMPLSDIQQTLAVKFSANYREEHLEVYRAFFFEPSRMTRKDWAAYLANKTSLEKHIYFTALSEDIETVKAELGLYSNVSVSEELSRLLRKSIGKAHQYLSLSNKESNHEAREWIKTSLSLVDKYEKYRSADASDFSKNLQMEFEYIDNEFPVPDEATLGALNKRLKAKEVREECDEGGV